MALAPGDIYSAQTPGFAQVLGSGLGALRVRQQEAYRRQQRAYQEAKAKQAQEAADARNLVPLAADGWLPHADELNAAVQQGYQDMRAKYADPTLSLFEKRQYGQQKAAELKALADRSNELKTQYKDAVALGADKRYNKQALEQGLYNLNFRTDENGQRQAIPLAQMDGTTYAAAASNPDYYNPTEVVNKFLDELGTKEQIEYTEAARQGVAGRTRYGASNIFAYDDKGQPLWTTNGQGERVRKIASLSLLEQAALRDPFMAGLLRKQAQAGQQPTAASLMSLDPAQVSDADLEALNAQTDQRTPHGRQLLADLVRSYGTVTERNRELSPKAVPRPSAAGKPKYTVLPNTEGGQGGIGINNQEGKTANYPTNHISQAPTRRKESTGQVEAFGYDGAVHNQYIRQVPGQEDELVVNNSEPQNIQYGKAFTALVTPSGKTVRPPKGQNLTGQALSDWQREQREKDPRLSIETVVVASPRKGKNELGDREAVADQLARSYASDPLKRQPTRAELLRKADDLLAKQNVSYQIVYRGEGKREIDNYAPGAYNGTEKAAELERARQQADEASRPRQQRQKLRIGVPTPTTTPTAKQSTGLKMTGGKKQL